MPIIDLQRGVAESGRIRIGQLVPSSNGKSRPEKLDTFRLTSADRRRIDQVAELYGGTVSEWTAPAGKQWQVVTATAELDVVVPPSELAFSQWYELWSAGGCQRRCDSVNETLSEGPCLCDPANRECDIHTRLSVMLRDLPGLGVWRIDTQGWYAAKELLGAVEILQIAAGHGALLPARLRLEQRSVKRPNNGRSQTYRFAVPVLDIEVSPAQLLNGGAGLVPLEQAALPAFTPVPQLPGGASPSIAEQSEPPAPRPPRVNAQTEIPASGRTRAARATEQPESGDAPAEPAEPPAQESEATTPSDTPASAPERSPVDVMVDLVTRAGKDPEVLRQQLGFTAWTDAPAETIAKLTAKAQEALEAQAEPVDEKPKKARASRAKKEA